MNDRSWGKYIESEVRMVNVNTTSVVLADDHESVRRGIRDLLRNAPDIEVIGEAADGIEALRSVEELEPDVLLLDIEMPGLNGIEVTRRLRRTGSQVRVLILSAYDDKEYIQEVLANGAAGYIVKGEAPRWVIEAVRGVARGEKGWVSEQVAKKLQEIKENGHQMTMTYRELEILRMMAEGKNEQEIASRLNLPPETVKLHSQKILNKLGVNSKEEAVNIATDEGWI